MINESGLSTNVFTVSAVIGINQNGLQLITSDVIALDKMLNGLFRYD